MQSPDPGSPGAVVTPLRPGVPRPYEKRLTDDAIDRLLDVILADLRHTDPPHECLLCLNRPRREARTSHRVRPASRPIREGSEPRPW